MPASTSPAHGRPDGGAPGAPAPQGATHKALSALLGTLKEDPSALPTLGAIALLVAWAANQAGYPQTHWAPGGIVLLALLVIAEGATGLRVASIPWPVRIAIAALAAYTAWSFLSILWAHVPGNAWEGADRTLLYLIVFTLFAGFRRTGASAAMLLCIWTFAMAGLAVYTVLRVDAASGNAAAVQQLMPEGRLTAPAGYVNANAALWMMAFYPAWLMAASRRLPALMRGGLAGGAAVLAAVALYSQSRGAVYSIPIMLVLIFVLLPGRVRNLITLIPIGLGVGACTPAVLHLAKALESRGSAGSAAHSATLSVLLAAFAVTVASTLLAARDAFRFMSCEVIDVMRLRGRARSLERLVEIRGREHLDAALAGGKGAILCSAHFGSQANVFSLLHASGSPLTSIGRWHWNFTPGLSSAERRFWDLVQARRLLRHRQRPNIEPWPGRVQAAAQAAFALRANEVVTICSDSEPQDGDRTAIEVPFLGRQARLLPGVVSLSRLTGAPVLMAFVYRSADYCHQVLEISPPVPMHGDTATAFGRCVAAIEAAIRRDPAHWFYWFQTDDLVTLGLLPAAPRHELSLNRA